MYTAYYFALWGDLKPAIRNSKNTAPLFTLLININILAIKGEKSKNCPLLFSRAHGDVSNDKVPAPLPW